MTERVYVAVFGGRCVDCDIRGALSITGTPIRSAELGYMLTSGCAGCRGTGTEIMYEVDVTALVEKLTAKQRFVVELRHGVRDGKKHTQQEIASLMGITQQSVAQHEQLAVKKLRDLAGF